MVHPQAKKMHAIVIPITLLMISSILAGCLTAGDLPEACKDTKELFLETVSPEGYNTQGANDSDVPVRLNEEVVVQLHGQCPAESYRWEIMDQYTAKRHRGNVDWDDPNHSQDEGGFGLQTFETKNKTVTLEFPQVGEYRVIVDLLDEKGTVIDDWGKYGFYVHAYHVADAVLPDDGSVWTTSFPAFCCPGVSRAQITSEGAIPVSDAWTARLVVESTNEVIWEGRPSPIEEHAMWKELGWQWNETIRYEVEPVTDPILPPEARRAYQIEFRIGPTVSYIDDA